MTTLYRPVLIETAEQAEALPDGAVAQHPEMWSREKYEGRWHDGIFVRSAGAMTGWTALVPIEAEVQTVAAPTSACPDRHVTRYATPWEEA